MPEFEQEESIRPEVSKDAAEHLFQCGIRCDVSDRVEQTNGCVKWAFCKTQFAHVLMMDTNAACGFGSFFPRQLNHVLGFVDCCNFVAQILQQKSMVAGPTGQFNDLSSLSFLKFFQTGRHKCRFGRIRFVRIKEIV